MGLPVERGIQVVLRQDLPQQTVRSQVCNDVVVFGYDVPTIRAV